MVDLIIYQKQVIDTYLFFIKENLKLINKLANEEKDLQDKLDEGLDSSILLISRAKHLQIMSLIGLNAEHLIKLILLKRGFVLNKTNYEAKFNDEFLKEIEISNKKNTITQADMDSLYLKSQDNVQIKADFQLLDFEDAKQIFTKSSGSTYFNGLQKYIINPRDDSEYNYFGVKEIVPERCFELIQRVRNSYLHKAEAKKEQNGVRWYFMNFLIWISKKEYPDFFKDIDFIGSRENKALFGA